jgi:hypothetical protein
MEHGFVTKLKFQCVLVGAHFYASAAQHALRRSDFSTLLVVDFVNLHGADAFADAAFCAFLLILIDVEEWDRFGAFELVYRC